MRIALVSDWYAPRRGGMEMHLATLASRLKAAGHDVHVITGVEGPSSDEGATIHRLETPRLPFAGVALAPSLAAQVADVLRRERIDVVHSHVSIIAPVALAGGLAAERLGLPSVLTFHSFVPATPVLASAAGFLLGADHWHATMTGVSSRVCAEVSMFAPHRDFIVLPNAIDTAFWTPSSHGAPSGPVTLVYAGRLNAKKHPERAIRAAALLRRRAPAQPMRLVMCGSGPLEGRLRGLAAAEGIEDVVEFIGWTEREALRELYRSSHLFLSTATRESFGIAALEARACGLPVVAMRRSAVSDFVVDGESGALVETAAEFARTVADLALDPRALASLRDHNTREAPPFSWEGAIASHLALYRRAQQEVAA